MNAFVLALTALLGGAACREEAPVPAWATIERPVATPSWAIIDRSAAPPAPEAPRRPDTTPPRVTVISPRAGTATGRDDGAVSIRFRVTDDASGLRSVSVAGRALEVPEGRPEAELTASVPAREGLVALPIDVVDVAGNRRRVLHPLVVADSFMTANAPLPAEAAVQVTAEGLARDSLGRLVEEALSDFSVEEHLPTPLAETMGHAISLEDLSHGAPLLTLTPQGGGVRVRMRIPAFAADVVLEGPLEARSRIRASAIVVDLSVFAGLAGGRAVALPGRVAVALEGLDVGLPSTLPSLTRTIRTAIERQLSARLRDEVQDALPDAMTEVAAALRGHQRAAVGLPLGGADPVDLAFDLRPSSVVLSAAGVSASVVATVRGPDTRRPIPRLTGCGDGNHVSVDGPMSVTLPFEVVNALSHAFHAGGGWDVEIPAAAVGAAAKPIEVEVRLPPLVTRCGAPSGAVLVQLAGLHVRTVLRVAKLRLPVDAEVAFDIVVRVRATPDGQVELAPELVAGSLVSTSPLVESFAPALASHLIPFRLPPDESPRAFGLDFHIRRVAVDHAGLVLEGSAH